MTFEKEGWRSLLTNIKIAIEVALRNILIFEHVSQRSSGGQTDLVRAPVSIVYSCILSTTASVLRKCPINNS